MTKSPTTTTVRKVSGTDNGKLEDAPPPSPTRVFDHHLRHAAQLELSPVMSPGPKKVYDHHQRHAAQLESPVASPSKTKKVYDHHQRHAAQLETPPPSPKRSQEKEPVAAPPSPPPPAVYDVGFHLAYSPKTKKTKSQQQVEYHKKVIGEILRYGDTPSSPYQQKVLKEVSEDIARIKKSQDEHHHQLMAPPPLMDPDLDGWMDDAEDIKAKEEYHQDVVKAILAISASPEEEEELLQKQQQQQQQPKERPSGNEREEAPYDEEQAQKRKESEEGRESPHRRHSSPPVVHKKKPIMETDIRIPDDSIEFEVGHHKRGSSLVNVLQVPEEEEEGEDVVKSEPSSPKRLSARDKYRAKKIAEYDIFEPTEKVLATVGLLHQQSPKSPRSIKPSNVKKHSIIHRMFHRS